MSIQRFALGRIHQFTLNFFLHFSKLASLLHHSTVNVFEILSSKTCKNVSKDEKNCDIDIIIALIYIRKVAIPKTERFNELHTILNLLSRYFFSFKFYFLCL